MNFILRRRKLGRTSCREIAGFAASPIAVVRNDKPIPNEGICFRWGTTTSLPPGVRVINSAEAIHRVNDKTGFRRILNEHNLCPKTWFSLEDLMNEDEAPARVVVRPKVRAQGRNLYVAHDEASLRAAVVACGEGYYISELINKVAEYRVFVAQGRAVWVAQKTPGNPEDVAWNVARGGRFDNVRFGDWNLRAVRIAIEGFNLSGLDFGGVDVMVDADGNAYILEINSAPSQTSPYRQECVSKVFDYIIANGKEPIPLIEARGGWRKFIHPAVNEEAILA